MNSPLFFTDDINEIFTEVKIMKEFYKEFKKIKEPVLFIGEDKALFRNIDRLNKTYSISLAEVNDHTINSNPKLFEFIGNSKVYLDKEDINKIRNLRKKDGISIEYDQYKYVFKFLTRDGEEDEVIISLDNSSPKLLNTFNKIKTKLVKNYEVDPKLFRAFLNTNNITLFKTDDDKLVLEKTSEKLIDVNLGLFDFDMKLVQKMIISWSDDLDGYTWVSIQAFEPDAKYRQYFKKV